jgi:plastocyanin
VTFNVTAKKGSTLSYFCAIHPWMQGTIKVK